MKATEQYFPVLLFTMLFTITKGNARAVIGQYLLIIILVNHTENVVIISIKAIFHTFQWFTGSVNHLGCWNNTRKACKSASARDLQSILMFFQHPGAWSIEPINHRNVWHIVSIQGGSNL